MNPLSALLEQEIDITPQQKKFVEAIFAGLSAKQALLRAGYSENTRADKIMTPNMQEYARYLQEKEKKRWQVTREQVTQGMLDAIQDAKVLEEPNTQINGWRELGRLHGLYAPEEKKVTLSAEKQERVRQVEEASLDELLDMTEMPAIEGDFEVVTDG